MNLRGREAHNWREQVAPSSNCICGKGQEQPEDPQAYPPVGALCIQSTYFSSGDAKNPSSPFNSTPACSCMHAFTPQASIQLYPPGAIIGIWDRVNRSPLRSTHLDRDRRITVPGGQEASKNVNDGGTEEE